MKIKYDLEKIAYNRKSKLNDKNMPCLPLCINMMMFNLMCTRECTGKYSTFTLSEQYDRFFLLNELYNRMCSMALRNYMCSLYYKEGSNE